MSDVASLVVRVRTQGVRSATGELDDLSTASRSTAQSMDKLKVAVGGLAAALSVRQVIAYADAWTTVTNKIANHVKENEELIDVQERVFKLAQDTRSSLQSTATLYGRLAAATGDFIKEGRTLEGLVSNINMAMQVSGATTAEAEGALVQLSQAFGAGALRGEEFNSVNEAAPRLMAALADSLGVARGALKSLAAEGKLTTEVLFTAWGEQSKFAKEVKSEFQNLTATAAANLVVAENNLTKWIGTNNTAIAVTKTFGQSAISLSENLDTLADAGLLLSGVIGGRLVGSLTQVAIAKASSAVASQRLAAAELAGAAASEASIVAEMALLRAQNLTWAARIRGAESEAMAARFRAQLTANTAALVTLETSLAGATTRLAAAQQAAAVSTRAFGGAMAMLGGPVGVAIAAATAISVFSASANRAADPTSELSQRVRQLTSDFKTLEVARVDETISAVTSQLDNLNARMGIAKKGQAEGAIMPPAVFETLDSQIAEANSNLDKLKAKRAEILKGGAAPERVTFPSLVDGGESKGDKKKKEQALKQAQADREQAQKYLDRLEQANMTELELIGAHEKEKLAELEKYRAQSTNADGTWKENSLISEQEYQAALTEIRATAITERTDLELEAMKKLDAANQEIFESEMQTQKEREAAKQKQMEDGKDALDNMTNDLRTSLGENNDLYKAAAITKATIDTYTAANAAFSAMAGIPIVGPILGGIAAGAAVVAGLANIAKIKSAREQGGNLAAGQVSTIAERGQPEVIMPASASRVRTAQQMRQIMGENGGSNAPTYVQIVNQTTGRVDSATTERMDEQTLRVIIRETVSGDMTDSNSSISKSRRATRGQAGF